MTRLPAAAALLALVLVAGCGVSRSTEPAPARLVVGVTIAGGTVTPTNEELTASVGEPIVVRVDSDTADELHVHSTPEHSFPITAAKGQSFQFTVDVPGRVDVELHRADKTIATIQVS